MFERSLVSVNREIERLPVGERAAWQNRVRLVLAKAVAGAREEDAALDAGRHFGEGVAGLADGLLDGVKVIRPGEPGYDEAKRAAGALPVEWDLQLANELDKLNGAVSERVREVASGAAGAVSGIGVSLLPLAAVVLVAAYVFRRK